jgi:hypothetical protein
MYTSKQYVLLSYSLIITKNFRISLEADTITVLTAFTLTEKGSVKIVVYVFIWEKIQTKLIKFLT